MTGRDERGFTLAELLIAVAIVLVLVAVALPVFAGALESSREATDVANIRSAYAEVKASALANDRSDGTWVAEDGLWRVEVDLEQAQDGWQDTSIPETLQNLATVQGTPLAQGTAYVECVPGTAAGTVTTRVSFAGAGTSGPTIDYGSSRSVGQYVYSQVNDMLSAYASGQSSPFDDIFSGRKINAQDTLELPNGETVDVRLYGRDYDAFEDTKTRMGTNRASLIYNKTTGKLSTIIYCGSDGSYASWTVDGDQDAWSDVASWKENAY